MGKNKKRFYNRYDLMIKEHLENIEEHKQYKQVYEKVYMGYKEKMKEDNFDINAEKIRLMNKSAGTSSNSRAIELSVKAIYITISIGFLIEFARKELGPVVGNWGLFICAWIPIIGLFLYGTYFKRNREIEIMANICLKVIEDIEKEPELKKEYTNKSCILTRNQ